MPETDEKIPLSTVARMMQTTPLNVLMHIKRGLLRGYEDNGSWLVERQSLEALLARTGGGKVADICSSGCAKRHNCHDGCS